jgi:hypothetical protein
MSRALAPKGGNDRVYTPPSLAQQIVTHFNPDGVMLEPCAGKLAFVDAMFKQPGYTAVCYCEIDKGSDFFKWTQPVDWIITNPPWSQFRQFLKHSMELADNIVFLALLNAWFMRARMKDVQDAGFGYVEALLLDTPPKPWPQTGFQLAAVHIKRGYTGDMKFSRLTT